MQNNLMGRRGFLAGAAAAGAVAVLGRRLPFAHAADAAPAGGKPNSVINGVHIGAITYSYRDMKLKTAEETLKALLDSGLSECELMDGPINAFIGFSGKATDKEREAMLKKAADLKKLYNDAGVNIHIHKRPFGNSDEEIEFNFLIAKALGCVAITTERDEKLARKLAPFAEKHKVYVGFHNHEKNLPAMDQQDAILDVGKYIALNLDVGHYFGGSKGKSPVPVIEKYHDRIVSLHLKDKTAEGRNLSWGKGGTPLKDVLQLLKKNKWPIYADIEVEYPIDKESNPVKEVAICLQYCRDALA
jgi:sugar phosphate isomerase/epimerase